jgi:hypothetical protein
MDRNNRSIDRKEKLNKMNAIIRDLNGNDYGCSCYRRQYAKFPCSLCNEYQYNGLCYNIMCDRYYNPVIVRCNKSCGKWMLSINTAE